MSDLNVALTLRLVDRLTAPMRRVGGALRGLGRAGDAVRRQLGGILGPAAALTSALSAGGIVALTRSYASAAEEIQHTSDRLGIGVEALQQYRHAAHLAGIESRTFDTALQRLNRRLADAAAGENQDVAALFERAGIALRDANGEVRASVDVLPELAALFEANQNAAVRTAMAFALFDSEGVAMTQMLGEGADAMAEARAEASELGGVMSGPSIAAAIAFNTEMARLGQAGEGLRNALGAELLPVFTPLVNGLTDWVKANRELIAQRFGDVAGRIADAIDGMDFQALHDFLFGFTVVGDRMTDVREVPGLIDRISSAIEGVVGFVGGWENAALALAAVLNANLLVSIGQVAAAIGRLGWVLAANPVGAAITGIALAALLIYRYWDDITAFFERIWRMVKREFDEAWGEIRPVVDWFEDAIDELKRAWEGIDAWFSELWGNVEQAFTDAWETIRPIVDLVTTAADNIANTLGRLTDTEYLIPSRPEAGTAESHGFEPDGFGGMVHPRTGQTWEAFQREQRAGAAGAGSNSLPALGPPALVAPAPLPITGNTGELASRIGDAVGAAVARQNAAQREAVDIDVTVRYDQPPDVQVRRSSNRDYDMASGLIMAGGM